MASSDVFVAPTLGKARGLKELLLLLGDGEFQGKDDVQVTALVVLDDIIKDLELIREEVARG